MKEFGFAMGPFAMFDLSGIDVAWHIARRRAPDRSAARTADRRPPVSSMKRLGQKTGAGYYKYDKGVREAAAARPRGRSALRRGGQAPASRRASITDEEIVATG